MSAVRLDLGCGQKPKEGFQGVDVRDYGRSDILVCDLRGPWKWDDSSVDEVWSNQFLEHLTARERVHFANELYRVLKPGASAEIIVPHWANARAYGDLTHQWPPVSPFAFLYLSKSWREREAPHADISNCVCVQKSECLCYSCDFTVNWGTSLDTDIGLRNQEFQQFAAKFYANACEDLHSTWIKPEAQ